MYFQVYHSLFSWIFFGCNEKIDSDPSSSRPNPIYLGQAVWVLLFYSTIYKNKTMFLSIPNPGVYSFGILYTVFATSTVLFKSSTGSRTLLDTFRVGTFLRLNQMLKFWNRWLIYIFGHCILLLRNVCIHDLIIRLSQILTENQLLTMEKRWISTNPNDRWTTSKTTCKGVIFACEL